jgi:hypothetical protein
MIALAMRRALAKKAPAGALSAKRERLDEGRQRAFHFLQRS